MRSFKILVVLVIIGILGLFLGGCTPKKYSILPGNRGGLDLRKRHHTNPQKGAIVVEGELALLIEVYYKKDRDKLESDMPESEKRKIRPVMTLKDGGKLPDENSITDARIYVRRLPKGEYSALTRPFCNHPITGKVVDRFKPNWDNFSVDDKPRDYVEENTGRRYGWVLNVNSGNIPGDILNILLENEEKQKDSWFFNKRRTIKSREGWQFFGEGDFNWRN